MLKFYQSFAEFSSRSQNIQSAVETFQNPFPSRGVKNSSTSFELCVAPLSDHSPISVQLSSTPVPHFPKPLRAGVCLHAHDDKRDVHFEALVADAYPIT